MNEILEKLEKMIDKKFEEQTKEILEIVNMSFLSFEKSVEKLIDDQTEKIEKIIDDKFNDFEETVNKKFDKQIEIINSNTNEIQNRIDSAKMDLKETNLNNLKSVLEQFKNVALYIRDNKILNDKIIKYLRTIHYILKKICRKRLFLRVPDLE